MLIDVTIIIVIVITDLIIIFYDSDDDFNEKDAISDECSTVVL